MLVVPASMTLAATSSNEVVSLGYIVVIDSERLTSSMLLMLEESTVTWISTGLPSNRIEAVYTPGQNLGASALSRGVSILEEAEAFTYAVSRESEEAQMTQEVQGNVQQTETTEVSAQPASNGQAIVDYACQFIGNPYVWGGTSLTDGADCSGFVQSVFAHFGISLPRTTYDQINAGVEVSYDQAMPGDLICYDGHIGIYIGNGQIVNAQNPEQGIGISPATYTTILSVRRIV